MDNTGSKDGMATMMLEQVRDALRAVDHSGMSGDTCDELADAIDAHLAQPSQAVDVDSLAQEIRRVDGSHSLGAAALAEALTPFITRALSGEKAGPVGGWQPIETAPKDGSAILIADIQNGVVYDVLNGHFEVLAEDEDDGPWDIRDGEPWCSYEGRGAGIYFCHWLPGKEWESRWLFGHDSGYTHWMPLPASPAPDKEGL